MLSLTLDQAGDSPLRFGRGLEMNNRLRRCTRSDEVDNLEIGGAGRTHSCPILHEQRDIATPQFAGTPAYGARSTIEVTFLAQNDSRKANCMLLGKFCWEIVTRPKVFDVSPVSGP